MPDSSGTYCALRMPLWCLRGLEPSASILPMIGLPMGSSPALEARQRAAPGSPTPGAAFLLSCRLVRPWSPVRRALPERGPGDLVHLAAIDAHGEDVRLAGITGLGEHNPRAVG